MRFHQVFLRDKPATKNPLLGTDVFGTSASPVSAGGLAAAVTTGPNSTRSGPYVPGTTNDGKGTILICPFKSIDGWPVQRIAVVARADWAAPGSTTVALTANGYIWEVLTQTWQKVNASPITITPGVVAYFDAVTLASQVQVGAGMGVPNSGALEFLLEVLDGGTSNGTFTFAMAPCMTSSP